MPNVNYAFRGYNILIGNPMATKVNADKGFKNPIFQATYSGQITNDLRYEIPDGFSVFNTPICRIDFSSDYYVNEKTYQKSLEVSFHFI